MKTFNISIHNIQKHDYISILNFLSWILHFPTKKLKCIKNIRSAEECNTLHAALNVLAKFMRQLECHCLLMELVNAYCRISYDVFSTYIKCLSYKSLGKPFNYIGSPALQNIAFIKLCMHVINSLTLDCMYKRW